MIRAVFFDVGNTLIHAFPSVGEIYSSIGRKHGMLLAGDAVNASFKRSFLQHSPSDLTDKAGERGWWKQVVWETIAPLCDPDDFEGFFDELFDFFSEAAAWRLFPDVAPTLDRLRAMGLVLGVISNWDSRLLRTLDNLNLSPYFSVIAVSALVGSAKPDAEIFRYALERAGVAPEQAIHIGDSVELDVQGASECGIHALLIDRKDRFPENSAYARICSLEGVVSRSILHSGERDHPVL